MWRAKCLTKRLRHCCQYTSTHTSEHEGQDWNGGRGKREEGEERRKGIGDRGEEKRERSGEGKKGIKTFKIYEKC